ncbi:hypothetical protein D3C86_2106610 [compost metagenome]
MLFLSCFGINDFQSRTNIRAGEDQLAVFRIADEKEFLVQRRGLDVEPFDEMLFLARIIINGGNR